MLDWLGTEVDRLRTAFIQVFGERHRPFGNRSSWIGGLSDANEGVQWSVGYDPRDGSQWVGVNLEGMKYDGWPIARLITRELRRPTLPGLIRQLGDTGPARVHWTRDYWQATSRPPIVERNIAPTPVLLSQMTEHLWHQALEDALACLDPNKNRRGRANQGVTLARSGVRVIGPVSPHLKFVLPAPPRSPWPEFLAQAKEFMQPFYDWTRERAA